MKDNHLHKLLHGSIAVYIIGILSGIALMILTGCATPEFNDRHLVEYDLWTQCDVRVHVDHRMDSRYHNPNNMTGKSNIRRDLLDNRCRH